VAFSLNRFSQIGFANFAHSWWFLLLPQRAQKDTSPCLAFAKTSLLPHPVLAFAKTSLSLRKERDVAERQGEVKNGLLCELCAFLCVLRGFFLFTTKGAKKELHETDSKRSEKFKYVLDEP